MLPLSGGQYRPAESWITAWPWLIQQIVALVIPILWELFLSGPLRLNEFNPLPALGSVGIQILNPLIIFLLGFPIGFWLRAKVFKASNSGKYVWILPVAILTLYVAYDLFLFNFDWKGIYLGYFYSSSPGSDEGPILRDLLVYPAWSSFSYSLGVALRARAKG